jgi:hypothetical protein
MPREYKRREKPEDHSYPDESEFASFIKFWHRYNPRAEGPEYSACDSVTRSRFAAVKGAEKLYEIEGNIGQFKRNILDQPFPISSFERFAWVLYCKLKQKKDID